MESMDETDKKFLEWIEKRCISGKIASLDRSEMRELQMSETEYEDRLISMRASGYLYFPGGLIVAITGKGLDALKKK
jgi:hypothetical protein